MDHVFYNKNQINLLIHYSLEICVYYYSTKKDRSPILFVTWSPGRFASHTHAAGRGSDSDLLGISQAAAKAVTEATAQVAHTGT